MTLSDIYTNMNNFPIFRKVKIIGTDGDIDFQTIKYVEPRFKYRELESFGIYSDYVAVWFDCDLEDIKER